MKKLLPITLAFLLLNGFSTLSATASSPPTRCAKSLKSVKSSISSLKVFQMHNIPTEMGRPPRGRSKYLVVSVQGNLLMNNTAKQKNIAQKVMKNCSQVGLVSFNLNQSDWVNMYGFKNGRVRSFECKEMGSALVWGQYGCL